MKTRTVPVFLLFLAGGLFAQEKQLYEKADEVAKEKANWIWKNEFSEEIADLIIGTKIEKRVIKDDKKGIEIEEDKIFPKVIIEKTGIRFLKETGDLINKVSFIGDIPGAQWTKIVKSKNEKFISTNEILKYNKGIEQAKFTTYSTNGKLLWQCDHNYENIILSPNGEYAVAPPFVGVGEPLLLLTPQGIKKIDLKINERAYSNSVDFLDDGKYFAINIGTPPTLILFDRDGRELWRRELELRVRGELRMSPNRSFIVASSFDIEKSQGYLYSFDFKGNLLWKKNIAPGSYIFELSSDEKYLLAAKTNKKKKYLYYLDTKTGESVWEYDGRFLPIGHIENISYNSHSKFTLLATVASGLSGHEKGSDYIHLFDGKGKKIWQKEFRDNYLNYTLGYENQVLGKISHDGNIIIKTEGGILEYKDVLKRFMTTGGD